MGGFAASIGPNGDGIEAIVELMDHRSTHGLDRVDVGPAHLVEGRLARDGAGQWEITSSGRYTIVGDIAVWDRTRLEQLVGGGETGTDRDLILAGFASHGPDVFDAIDGDFAMVIWDSLEARAVAARDRFGVKPLWVSIDSMGFAAASEQKFVAAITGAERAPSAERLREYVELSMTWSPPGWLDGIDRVLPGHFIDTARPGEQVPFTDLKPIPGSVLDVAAALESAVSDRVQRARRTMSHLSGGLDSSTIVACIARLRRAGAVSNDDVVTASALTPGLASDESASIAELARTFQFEHRTYVPQPGSVEDFLADMRTTDSPVAHPTRDIGHRTAAIARTEGCDLIITGTGGDETMTDARVLPAKLRSGDIGGWLASTGIRGTRGRRHRLAVALESGFQALPTRTKARIRQIAGKPEVGYSSEDGNPIEARLHRSLRHGRLLHNLEYQEAIAASYGLEVTHPFLDRRVVAAVAGIPASQRPITRGNKAILRTAFADDLPDIVLLAERKTSGDAMLRQAVETTGGTMQSRLSAPSNTSATWLPGERFAELSAAPPDQLSIRDLARLWNSWSALVWTEDLSRG